MKFKGSVIQDSVATVQDGSKLVDESGRHLNDIVAAAKKVADIIGEISAASQQQAGGLDQVNRAIMQMDETTQQNTTMVEETSSVATSMTSQARTMKDLVAVFKVQEGTSARPAVKTVQAPPAPRKPQAVAAPAPLPQRVAGLDCQWQEF